MKGVLFLGVAGTAMYMALVLSHDFLPGDKADRFTRELSGPRVRQLSSWGANLPALERSQASSRSLSKPAWVSEPYEGEHRQGSDSLARATMPYEATEWVRLVLATRMHREASVSSPTIGFYQPGTVLQVISREGGWVQITDPTSRDDGWVLEKYLVPTERPTVTQIAMSASTNETLSEPMPAKPVPGAKRARASKPAVQVPQNVATAQLDSGWERRAARRRGFGFFFNRFARAD